VTVVRGIVHVTVVIAGALVVTACGGGDGGEVQPDPLDIVREQAEASGRTPAPTGPASSIVPTSMLPSSTAALDAAVDELPSPDGSAFVGRNRVANLWVGQGGITQMVDVWARRTFTNGPVLLAEGLPFGAASEYFAAPANHSIVVVGAGAGPDGLELASMLDAGDGKQITMIFTNDDDTGRAWAPNVFEVDPSGANSPPSPPSDGNGLVYLYAPNTRSFESSLNLAIGAAAFYVGDAAGDCAKQRIEDDGFAASVLGGAQNVQLDLPPGPARLSLHAWPSADECSQPSLLDIGVDVVPGSAVMVLVFSRDGASIEALQLPMPLG
jgi:hypothetical protein